LAEVSTLGKPYRAEAGQRLSYCYVARAEEERNLLTRPALTPAPIESMLPSSVAEQKPYDDDDNMKSKKI
jgi:hypothetical protein